MGGVGLFTKVSKREKLCVYCIPQPLASYFKVALYRTLVRSIQKEKKKKLEIKKLK